MASIVDRLAAAAREAVGRLLEKQRIRLGVKPKSREDKRIYVTSDPDLSLPGLYEASAREQGVIPRKRAIQEVRRVAAGYLDAQQAAAEAAMTRVVSQVLAPIADGRLTPEVKKDLLAAIDHVLEKVGGAVERIVDTEATAARNLAGVEAVSAMGTAAGDDDPNVFFVTVRDGKVCGECVRLHLLDGKGSRPRVYKLSECSRSYHRKGDDRPSLLGEHPRCRCTLSYLAKGFGFDDGGNLRFVSLTHDEYAAQRRAA